MTRIEKGGRSTRNLPDGRDWRKHILPQEGVKNGELIIIGNHESKFPKRRHGAPVSFLVSRINYAPELTK